MYNYKLVVGYTKTVSLPFAFKNTDIVAAAHVFGSEFCHFSAAAVNACCKHPVILIGWCEGVTEDSQLQVVLHEAPSGEDEDTEWDTTPSLNTLLVRHGHAHSTGPG